MPTKVTIETCYGTYSVEVDKDDMNFPDVWEEVIIPVLLATGYSYETIVGI